MLKIIKIVFSFFILITFYKTNAQEFKPHIGINLNAASQTLSFSPVGLRAYGNVIFENQINLRTNFSFNFHSVNNTLEVTSLVNCFYMQMEESIIYQIDKSETPIFFGAGIGYYAVRNYEEASHLQQPEPFNYNLSVGHDNYDSNIGFHILFGKDTGKLILEFKYTYTVFQHNQYQQGSINSVYFERIVSKNETFHFFQFSVSI